MKKVDIAVIGKDRRILNTAEILSVNGYCVRYYENWEQGGCTEEISSAKVILGDIPFKGEKEIICNLRPGQYFFAGVLTEEFITQCRIKQVTAMDFMKEESIAVYNAIATAEGTIMEAIRNKDTNLHKSKCLVLGYGRCGKALCERLKGLSAHVTVTSQSEEELSWADVFGADTFHLCDLRGKVQYFEYIFNTIPAMILSEELLRNTRPDVLILDIASGEGGVCYADAERMGRKAIHCLALPGKYAPRASACCLADYMMKKL